jgi:von Willebrand factor type A C-terminal domain/von Willebrand factor type A domain
MTTFGVEVFQNEYLAAGAGVVDAVVTVKATGGAALGASVPQSVEIIIIDCSGSMNEEGGAKIRAARDATCAAIDTIRDGVSFAVVAGTDIARMLYPDQPGLTVADTYTKGDAKRAVRQVHAEGGTAIGTWLDGAAGLASTAPGAIAHAILLTDGKNQNQEPGELEQAIARCTGLLQVDCRGLGVDWNVNELRKIATALLGTVDIIPRPEEMTAEFESLIQNAMGKQVGRVALRLWVPQGAELEFIKQVAPSLEDLTPAAVVVNPLTREYPLGAWGGDEERDYHVRVRIPVGGVGEERLGARVNLLVDGTDSGSGLVRAIWTEDEALSTRINREVAHYTGQADLADAIAEGLAAREAGDEKTATLKLGRAVQLAHEGGNDGTVKLLGKVVQIDDPATGTIRLKREVAAADAMALDVRSTRTVRVTPGAPPPAGGAAGG